LVDRKQARPGEVTIGDNRKHLGLDADENVLLADDFGHAIKKYLVAEKRMAVVAGTGVRGAAGLDGPPSRCGSTAHAASITPSRQNRSTSAKSATSGS
jgi:hypothetical protein